MARDSICSEHVIPVPRDFVIMCRCYLPLGERTRQFFLHLFLHQVGRLCDLKLPFAGTKRATLAAEQLKLRQTWTLVSDLQ